MDAFLDPDPGWIPIGGRDHLLYVAGVVLLAVLLLTRRARVREHASGVRRVLLAVVVVQQLTLYSFYAATGWDNAESLPLHVSRVTALLCLVYLATGSRRVMDLVFYLGLWAWASFAYPQNVQPATHVLGWSFFVNHAVTLLMPVLAWVGTGWRPTRAALWRAFGFFLVYVAGAVAANAVTGGNYFYQRERPLLPFLPQPWYLLASVAATLTLFWIGYGVSRLVARASSGTWSREEAARPQRR